MADEDNVNCKIYVGSLSYDTNNEKLKEFFEKVGPVVKASVVREPITETSRGFGFVAFEHPECVQKAIEEMNDKELDGRAVKVDRAEKRRGGPPGTGGGFRGGRGGGRGGRGGFSDRRDDFRERRDYYNDGFNRGYEGGRYRRDDYGSGDYYGGYDRYERYSPASGYSTGAYGSGGGGYSSGYGRGGYGRGGYGNGYGGSGYENSYGRYDYRGGEGGGYGGYRSGGYGGYGSREGYYGRDGYY